jgi:hypothetical protein
MYWSLELYENNYFPAARPFLHKHQVLELLFFFCILRHWIKWWLEIQTTLLHTCLFVYILVNDNTAYACTFLYKRTQFAKI